LACSRLSIRDIKFLMSIGVPRKLGKSISFNTGGGVSSPSALSESNLLSTCGATKRALDHDRSTGPRQGAHQNSTWPAPLAGRGSRCCF
jgi:hypothetical protein